MHFSDLPIEIYYNIFKYLGYEDMLVSVSMINIEMNSIVNSYREFSNVKKLSSLSHRNSIIYMRNKECCMLFRCLGFNRTIEDLELDLSDSISIETIRELSQSLETNLCIVSLSLYLYSADQFLHLSQGLKNSVSIKNLDISLVKSVQDLIDYLCDVLKENKYLTSLDISYMHIGNEKMDQIIRSLCNSSITSLYILSTSCIIDRKFLDALNDTNLELVDVSYNKIIDYNYRNKIKIIYNID